MKKKKKAKQAERTCQSIPGEIADRNSRTTMCPRIGEMVRERIVVFDQRMEKNLKTVELDEKYRRKLANKKAPLEGYLIVLAEKAEIR